MFIAKEAWAEFGKRFDGLEGRYGALSVRYDRLVEINRALVQQIVELKRDGYIVPSPQPAAEEPEKFPEPIDKVLSQWDPRSGVWQHNAAYARTQLRQRPEEADIIAAEIAAGEDVEAL